MLLGAPEGILDRCTRVRVNGTKTVELRQDMKDKILQRVTEYGTGEDTLRCLGLATVDEPINLRTADLSKSENFKDFEQEMTFVGVVGIIDPPPSLREARH